MFKRLVAMMLAAIVMLSAMKPMCVNAVGEQAESGNEKDDGTITQYRYRDKEFLESKENNLEDPWIFYDIKVREQHGTYKYWYLPQYKVSGTGTGSGYTSAAADDWARENRDSMCIHGSKRSVKGYIPLTGSLNHIYVSEYDYDSVDLTKYTFCCWNWEFTYCGGATDVTMYCYYKWTEWSEWSETEVIPLTNREVETRSVFTVSYDADGGENAPVQQRKLAGEIIVLPVDHPTKVGYIFKGWSTVRNGDVEYQPGEEYAADKSVVLYAVWEYDSALTVKVLPNKTAYQIGEKLDTTGLVLVATYSDGRKKEIAEGFTVSGFDSSTVGKKTVVITYEDFATVFTVYVYAEGTCGGDVIWRLDENGELTISGSGAMANYSSYSEVPWYNQREYIRSAKIENSVTRVGTYAFYQCTSLTHVTIGENIAVIGNSAFNGCTSLAEIAIPDSVLTIGNYAFSDCGAVAGLKIGNSVTSLGNNVFSNCTGLSEITIPNSVTTIGDSAFRGCNGLLEANIGNGVQKFGYSVFSGCSKLKTMTIPTIHSSYGSVYPLGYLFGTGSYTGGSATEQKYGSSTSDKATYYIPTGLKSVTVTGGNISEGAFYNCENLTNITLGDAVTGISTNAFYNCKSLTDITIGRGVKYIQSDAFYSCSRLKNVYISDMAAWCGISFTESGGNPLSYAEYLYLNNKLVTDLVIPAGIKEIKSYAFRDYNNLASVTIPDSVTKIGKSVFYNCSDLVSVYYCGTLAQWNEISVESGNVYLLNANLSVVEPELTGIAVKVNPDKTGYWIGDSLDTTGLVLNAIYSDCSTEEIVSGYTVSGFDSLSAGSKTVTVTYEGFTTTFIVDVYAPVVDETAPRIVVDTAKGLVGDTVNVTIALENNPGIASMKLKVHYGEGLVPVEVVYNTAIGGQFQPPQNLNNPIVLNWFNGIADSEGDWTYATISFRIEETAAAGGTVPITVTYEPNNVYDITETDIFFAVVSGGVEIADHTPGDINGDRIVDNKDVTRLFQYVSEWDVEVVEAALDVNGDGIVDNKDVTRLFQYVSEWNVEIH